MRTTISHYQIHDSGLAIDLIYETITFLGETTHVVSETFEDAFGERTETQAFDNFSEAGEYLDKKLDHYIDGRGARVEDITF